MKKLKKLSFLLLCSLLTIVGSSNVYGTEIDNQEDSIVDSTDNTTNELPHSETDMETNDNEVVTLPKAIDDEEVVPNISYEEAVESLPYVESAPEIVDESKQTSVSTPALAEVDTTLPTLPEPTFNGKTVATTFSAIDFGQTYVQELGGLNFYNENGINMHYTAYLGEMTRNKASRLDKIEFPAFDGIALDSTTYPEIQMLVMGYGWNSVTSGVAPLKIVKNTEDLAKNGFTLTREEMSNFLPGEAAMANEITIQFNVVDSGSTNNTIKQLKLDGPIRFHYSIVNDQVMETPKSFTYYQNIFRYVESSSTTTSFNPMQEYVHYNYFNTTKVDVNFNKTTDIIPGETIEATFTLTNESTYPNRLVYAGITAPNLTLSGRVTGDLDLPQSEWQYFNDYYILAIGTLTSWIDIQPKQTLTFKMSFVVSDTFHGDEFTVTPSRLHAYDTNPKSFESKTLQMKKFGVTYDGNGEILPTTFVDTATYNLGAVVPIKDYTGVDVNGKHIVEWNTKADGTGTSFTFIDGILSPVATGPVMDSLITDRTLSGTTLYAIWSNTDYFVTYDNNGGEGTTPMDTNTYALTSTFHTAPGTGLTKEGYEFIGWSTEPTPAEETPIYLAEEAVSFVAHDVTLPLVGSSKTLTLYAQWKKVPVIVEEPKEDPVTPPTSAVHNGVMFTLIGIAMLGAIVYLKRKEEA